MDNNTILRIKVPAHLYESVKEQLTLKEAKGGKSFGGWTVVKEKKAPKDGMKKVEEEVKDDKKKGHSLDELKKAKAALDKKIEEMEMSSKEKVDEAVSPEIMDAISQIVDFAKDNAGFLAGIGGITGIAKMIADKIKQDPEARKSLDQKTGAGSTDTRFFEEKKEEKIEEKKEERTTIGVWSEPARDGAILKLIRTIDPDAYYSSVGGGGTRDFYAKGKPEVYKKLLSKYGTKIFRIH